MDDRKRKNIWEVGAIIVAYFLFCYGFSLFNALSAVVRNALRVPVLPELVAFLFCCLPVVAVLVWLQRGRNFFRSVGLMRSFGGGMVRGMAFALPSFLISLLTEKFNADVVLSSVLTVALYAFFLEFVYRGFAFGQLFHGGRLGFLPTMVVLAVPFALPVLWNGNVWMFLLAFLGCMWDVTPFSWLYAEWNRNLGVTFGMSLLIRTGWLLFPVREVRPDGFQGWGSVAYLICIVLAVAVTVIYKCRRGIPFRVNGKNLWRAEPSQADE